jgi:hypothetical protein
MSHFSKSQNFLSSKLIPRFFYLFVIITVLFSTNTYASIPEVLKGDKDALVINPAYKIKRMSTGVVIAYSTQMDGEAVRHEFENLYADVLLGAVRKQSISQLIPILARKYYYATDECRREIKHAVHVLEEWEILVADEVLP